MVGRSRALDQLVELLDATTVPCSDPPTFALLAGEAGIGKTRLLRALLDLVEGADGDDQVVVLAGGAEPDGIDRPFSAVASVLGAALDSDRTETWVEALVERLSGRRGLVVIEDLHWADGQSVAVIDQLSRAPLSQLLLVGTYRPEDLSRRLPGGELLSRLERRQLVERIRLEPLTRSEVGLLLTSLLDAPPSSAVIEALHLRSGGNPFIVEELVASCCAGGPEELAAAALPWSLEDAVRSRLEGLGPAERRVMDAASVCGSASTFDALADIAELTEPELIEVLRSLLDQGLLVETSEDRFDFRHALVRDAVAAQLLGRERRRLHQRALEVVTRRSPDELATRARLAAGAGHLDELVELARAGARSYLARGSSFVALRLADLALREEPDDPELLGAATEAAWLVDLDHEALAHAMQWRACAGDDLDQQVDALRWLVRLHYELGELAQSERCLAELRELVEGPAAGTAAFRRGAAALAQMHMLRAEVDEAVTWADAAEVAAVDHGDIAVAIQARLERASALVQRDGERVRPELESAIADAQQADLWVLAARGLNNLFELTPMYAPDGPELLARFRQASERAGFDWATMSSVHFREIDRAFGEGDQAAVRRAVDLATGASQLYPGIRSYADSMGVYLLLEDGRVGPAEAALAGLATSAPVPAEPATGFTLRALRLFAAGLRGDAGAASSLLAELVAQPLGGDRPTLNAVLEVLGAARAAGVPDDRLAEMVLPWVRAHPDGGAVAEFSALLLSLNREPASVGPALAAMLDDPGMVMRRPVRATFRLDVAQALAAAGEREAALTQLDRAEEELRRWPGWRRDRAAALRRRLDTHHVPATEGALTAREREVASLLAEGLTNGQLAARLFISPKTAAVHVSNILMKLQMSSRAEVAAWAVRTGLADEPAAG